MTSKELMKGHYYLLMNKLFEDVYFENVYLDKKEEEFKPRKSLRSRYGLNPVNEDYYKIIKIYNDTNSK